MGRFRGRKTPFFIGFYMKIQLYNATVFKALEYLQTGQYSSWRGSYWTPPQDGTWKFPVIKPIEKDVLTLTEFKDFLHESGIYTIDKIPVLAINIAALEAVVDKAISQTDNLQDLLVKLEEQSCTSEFDRIGFDLLSDKFSNI